MDLTDRDREQLGGMLGQAERALRENLMPFWADHAPDNECGGFLTRLDRRGGRLEDREKVAMMHARLIHSFSAAHRHGLRNRPYLELANAGFDFLVSAMWDREEGGFFYSVTRDGAPLCARKNTDVHGYALTGLSEYYLASGRPEALAWAERVFDVLMEKAADGDRGFIEDFDGREWDVLNAGQMSLCGRRDIRTMDMHTNVLEGMMCLCAASGKETHRRALRELARLVCEHGVDPVHGCTVTAFDRGWNPVPDMRGERTTSYGLNVELAWILHDTATLVGDADGVCRDRARALMDHALAFGFDHGRGGLAANGPLAGRVENADALPENRLVKTWWAQAEMLNALGTFWTASSRRDYFEAFAKEFGWIHRHQMDHECGDWYQETAWDSGAPLVTDKGNEFKTSFHAGRSLVRACETLRGALERRPGGGES